jgi:hypothetical protein
MRGNKMTDEEVAARDQEVERAIACEAKQTWPSLIIGERNLRVYEVGEPRPT